MRAALVGMLTCFAAAALCHAAGTPANDQDLTMFRGNYYRNLSAVGTVPKKPKMLWRLYVGGILEGTAENRGVDPGTWWAGLGWTGQPAKVGNRYYFGSLNSYVYCVDAATGTVLWKQKCGHSIKGSVNVVGDRLYHGCRDNRIRCRRISDGAVIWSQKIGNDMDSSPLVMHGAVIVGGEDGAIYCFAAATGARWWTYRTEGSNESSPTWVDGKIYQETSERK